MVTDTPTQEEWLAATAKPLDLTEMDELVKESVEAWAAYDKAKKAASELYSRAEALDYKIIAALKEAGKKSYKVDGIGTMSLVQTATVRIPASVDHKKKFFSYLEKEAGEEFMYAMMTVNSQSLNSWYRKKFEEAEQNGSLLGFNVPGVEPGATRETLSFRTDRKGK